MRAPARPPALLALLALLVAGPARAAEPPPSPVVYPPQAYGILFSHRLHLDDLDMECTACHVQAPSSREASDKLIPREEACGSCHDIGRDTGDCAKCHVTSDPASLAVVPTPNLRFPHAAHVERGIACLTCHAGVAAVDLARREHLPMMGLCLDCHDGRQAPEECVACHPGAGGGRMTTRFAAGLLKPRSHDEEWWRTHRLAGRAEEKECRACHQEPDCLECHRGGRLTRGAVVKPRFHPNDWILTHSRAAYADDPTCSSCHARELFCVECHRDHRATLATLPAERLFHPPGWADLGGGAAHHSHVARRNVAACASCHQERDCLACHSTQTLAINPHPPGFDPGRLRREQRGMCRKCHDASDPALE